jgi:RNA polymerase subunit RPABC4/transcription elongation factor Spt4
MSSERRCPDCGALVTADADWCGQCYTSLRSGTGTTSDTDSELEAVTRDAGTQEPATPDMPAAPLVAGAPDAEPGAEVSEAVGGVEPQEGELTWSCPVCERRNPMDLDVCTVCGTPFGRLFQEPEKRPEISPKDAAAWSVLLPGLGHWKSGRKPDGVARWILLAWTVGTLAVLLVSRFGTGGLGPTASLVYLFVAATALLYVESAVDAYRVAAGDRPLLSSRGLMWAVVGLVLLSVLLGSLVVLPAARGG